MTRDEALATLRQLSEFDNTEHDHLLADEILLRLIDDEEIRAAFAAIKRSYGHSPVGEQHYNTHLTENDVREIRRLRAAGVSEQELSRRYGIVRSAINNIVRRQRWKHVL